MNVPICDSGSSRIVFLHNFFTFSQLVETYTIQKVYCV